MAFYVTGDTHGDFDVQKLYKKNWRSQKELTSNDYLIICGDFGFIWQQEESKQEAYWLEILEQKKCMILFVDGNHENHPRLATYPVKEWNGGSVHEIRPTILHLMRGQVFDIDGSTFFTMGGASSHDKVYRTEGISWWPEELPSEEEYNTAIRNLERVNWKVDYVISHCCDTFTQRLIASYYEPDQLTEFFYTISQRLSYKQWYFGHYHLDQQIDDKHTGVFQLIREMGTNIVVGGEIEE